MAVIAAGGAQEEPDIGQVVEAFHRRCGGAGHHQLGDIAQDGVGEGDKGRTLRRDGQVRRRDIDVALDQGFQDLIAGQGHQQHVDALAVALPQVLFEGPGALHREADHLLAVVGEIERIVGDRHAQHALFQDACEVALGRGQGGGDRLLLIRARFVGAHRVGRRQKSKDQDGGQDRDQSGQAGTGGSGSEVPVGVASQTPGGTGERESHMTSMSQAGLKARAMGTPEEWNLPRRRPCRRVGPAALALHHWEQGKRKRI